MLLLVYIAKSSYFFRQAVHSSNEGKGMGRPPRLPERAVYCMFYRECLDLAATHDLKVIPCELCSVRRDLSVWESDFDEWDLVGVYLLLSAIFHPKPYHRYIIAASHCQS